MTGKRLCSLIRSLSFLLATLAVAGMAMAQVIEQVTYSFTGPSGWDPRTNLVFGPSGKLFGMTTNGGIAGNPACGKAGCGTVFELILGAGSNWNYHPLYSFRGGSDGLAPYGNIVFDAEGNLYGATSAGGTNNSGTVFKLTPAAGNVWTESIIHSFASSPGDGTIPYAGLIQDADGNLYGTTSSGGATDNGTVYQLTPNGDGSWSENIIYDFFGGNIDGADPLADLAFDAAGNLYGTTYSGGAKIHGTVFELIPTSVGLWTENVLYSFPGNELAGPRAPVWVDSTGTVYGTTCGQFNNQGTVFQLSPSAGAWTEKTLHTFGKPGDGTCPLSSLTPNAAGNLYGTATSGGDNGSGVVFKMVRTAAGSWNVKTIYSFGSGEDGANPWSGVTVSKGTTLYGTTTQGGSSGFGVVYKISP